MTNIDDEEKKLSTLRKLVDATCLILKCYPMTDEKAEKLIQEAKSKALELFPDKEDLFELIYRPRFNRIREERKAKKQ